ncbi:MAG: DUF4230 domain-containing protein [Ruminococcus sp.]|jgi:hypothetical protein|nr:DUF4230 domain-containing protein [Ruminococcus sp.]
MKMVIKRYVIIILLILAALTVFYITIYPRLKTVSDSAMTPQGIKKIAELSTLQYDYKEAIVISESEEFVVLGIDIDPREHILVATYYGSIKLGIDCKDIKINEYAKVEGQKTRVEIKLPEIQIISHETPFDSINIIIDRGIYTEKTVQKDKLFEIASENQAELEKTILGSENADRAREGAKEYLMSLFSSFSEIEENYEIVFVD